MFEDGKKSEIIALFFLRATAEKTHGGTASVFQFHDRGTLLRDRSMTLLLLITLLALDTTLVFAEWVVVERDYFSPGLQTVYMDPTSLQRDGNLVTISQLIDYKWMQGNYVGTPRFLSTTARKQFDCASSRVRSLSFTEYYGHMATGVATSAYVANDQWQLVESQTLNHALWEISCGQPIRGQIP